MIDSIHIRLHDMQKEGHRAIMDWLLEEKARHRLDSITILGSYDERLKDYVKRDPNLRQKYLHFQRFDMEQTVKQKIIGKKHVPSSRYAISWMEQDNALDFIFSVPKYLFGHNIAQFVPQTDSNTFQKRGFGYWSIIENQLENTYDRLLIFIKDFFADTFPDIPVDFHDLEIRRFDICLNQYFNTKADALSYLELQRRVVKSYVRENSSYGQDKWTSVNYKTQFYTFKIYHKGSEYAKNDRPKHQKLNEALAEINRLALRQTEQFTARKYIDTTYLQAESDRILRYEIAFNVAGMSNYYKTKVYQAKNRNFQIIKKSFNQIKNIVENEITAKSIIDKENKALNAAKQGHARLAQNLMNEARQNEKTLDNRLHLDKQDLKFYREFNKWLRKRHAFYIECDERQTYFPTEYGNAKITHDKPRKFSKQLFHVCAAIFMENVRQYQIKELPPSEKIYEQIEKYNQRAKQLKAAFHNEIKNGIITPNEAEKRGMKEIRMSKLIPIVEALQTRTLDEIKRERLYNERTFRNYQRELKKLDIFKNTVTQMNIPKPTLDFQEYYRLRNSSECRLFHETAHRFVQ